MDARRENSGCYGDGTDPISWLQRRAAPAELLRKLWPIKNGGGGIPAFGRGVRPIESWGKVAELDLINYV